MATFDQLSDEQRAIVELVLKQGKSYGELSDMLGLSETRVRELARDALVDLAPITARGVEEDWRGQLTDYVLGQQAGPEATATRGHLRRSEAARSWTRSLLDALEQLYPDGDVPAIPDGERGSRRGAAAAPPDPGGAAREPRALSPDAASAVRRRRAVTAAGVGVLILVALLVWPVGLLTGGDDEEPSQASSDTQATGGGGDDEGPIATRTQGQAIVARQQGATQVLVTATGLEPSTQNTAYQVYLSNSEDDRRSLGATVTDQQGNLQAGAELPANFEDYEFIDLTSVTVRGQGKNQRFEDGPTVLRGLVELRDKPVTRGTGNRKVTLLGEIRMLPLPD
ncbi:MAG TPA: sigma factor-like helix-turn-helix DNA-binding protein [Thermoleophilaceae bacterium]|nr:sigma factor-like helix-turn-helix DNA-binding protein [Thermoleophilaceae bacterium]